MDTTAMTPYERNHLALIDTYRRRLQPGDTPQVLMARIADGEDDAVWNGLVWGFRTAMAKWKAFHKDTALQPGWSPAPGSDPVNDAVRAGAISNYEAALVSIAIAYTATMDEETPHSEPRDSLPRSEPSQGDASMDDLESDFWEEDSLDDPELDGVRFVRR
jgi:hypothetical protein